MKRITVILLALAMLLIMTACGGTKILHCDGCDKEIEIAANSNMEEDWAIFCESCEKEIMDENPQLTE